MLQLLLLAAAVCAFEGLPLKHVRFGKLEGSRVVHTMNYNVFEFQMLLVRLLQLCEALAHERLRKELLFRVVFYETSLWRDQSLEVEKHRLYLDALVAKKTGKDP